jgi:hypothetical protein
LEQKMRNLPIHLKRAGWLACGIAVVLCLAMLLYVFPPSLGRALSKSGLLPIKGSVGGNAGVPGGDTLLW